MNRIINRRSVIKAAATIAAGSIATAQVDPGPQRIELFAEGIIPVAPWPFIAPPPPLPDDILQEITARRLEGRLRVTYPAAGNVVLVQVYFAHPFTPLGPAQDAPLQHTADRYSVRDSPRACDRDSLAEDHPDRRRRQGGPRSRAVRSVHGTRGSHRARV